MDWTYIGNSRKSRRLSLIDAIGVPRPTLSLRWFFVCLRTESAE
jgi:hypothetical protein